MRRFRRLRAGEQIRSLVRETRIDKGDLIYPIFIAEGENIKKPVDSMPNVYQYSLDRADEILKEIENSGIAGLLIFGIPKHKDELATSAYDDNGVTQNAIRYIKKIIRHSLLLPMSVFVNTQVTVIAVLFAVTKFSMMKHFRSSLKWLSALQKQVRISSLLRI